MTIFKEDLREMIGFPELEPESVWELEGLDFLWEGGWKQILQCYLQAKGCTVLKELRPESKYHHLGMESIETKTCLIAGQRLFWLSR